MALHSIESAQALQDFIAASEFSIVCFSAQWCGPCKASHPQLVQLAHKFKNDYGDALLCTGIVYEDKLGDAIHNYGIRAFPTYVMFCEFGRKEVGRVQGVNFGAVQQLVDKSGLAGRSAWKEQPGHSLGGGGPTMSAQEARLARIAALEKKNPVTSPSENVADDLTKPTEDIKDVEMKGVEESPDSEEMNHTADPIPEDPTANLNQEALNELISSMGFPLIRAQKGLLYGGNTIEGAVEWLLAHQEEEGIDDPLHSNDATVVMSYKCNDCGKILSNMANLELHANKTGHSDFAESTDQITPLTEEQKRNKMLEIKDLLAAKRAERLEQERKDNIEREKQRRLMGQEISKTREQLEIEQRKREAYMKKKEKMDAKHERERIRAELEKDKLERLANKGKLKGKLGVDGYNPDAIQYDIGVEQVKEHDEVSSASPPKTIRKSTMKVDECIAKVSAYRAGGDGEKCLKVLLAYVKNVVESDDAKFRTINMENKVFKSRVKPFIGAKQLLLAVGFLPDERNEMLHLQADANPATLEETKQKLERAIANY